MGSSCLLTVKKFTTQLPPTQEEQLSSRRTNLRRGTNSSLSPSRTRVAKTSSSSGTTTMATKYHMVLSRTDRRGTRELTPATHGVLLVKQGQTSTSLSMELRSSSPKAPIIIELFTLDKK